MSTTTCEMKWGEEEGERGQGRHRGMQIFTFGRYNANINLSTFIAEHSQSFVQFEYFFCSSTYLITVTITISDHIEA